MSSPEGAKPFSSGTKYGEVPLDDSDHETSEPITRLRRLSSALLEEQYHDSMPSALNKSPKIGVFEIDADGKTNYKETGLRNLSNYVNLLINLIDNAPPKDLGKKKSSLRINQDDLAIRSRASSSTPLPKVTRRQSLGRIDDSLQMALSAGSAKEATAPKQIAERLSEKIAPPIPVPIHSLSSTMKNQLNQLQAANNVGTMIKLSHRDIRRLDWHYNPSQDPLLLVRRHCILLSQHPFRVLIMAHRIFVLPPANPHDCALFHKLFAPIHQALLDWSLSAHTRRRSQTSIDRKPHPSPSRPRVSTMHLSPPEPFPFEFHCLEIIFTTALSINGHYVKLYAKQLKSALESYQAISSSRSHYLVTNEIDTMKSISNHITSLHILLQRMKTTLDTLADDEEELALMNLSYLESKPSLYKLPLDREILRMHERVEELLEVYLIDLNGQITQLKNMMGSIHHAEDKLEMQLDIMENKVLIASTLIVLLTCCVSLNGVVAGGFGMNLNFTVLEKMPFFVVLSVTMASILVLYMLVKRWLIYLGFIPSHILLSKETNLAV